MKKVQPSWERPRKADNPHSPEGVDRIKEVVKSALIRYYTGIAEVGMFEYKFPDDCFRDFNAMTRGVQPEKFLMQGNAVSFFKHGDQVHCLPAVLSDGGLNWYGNWCTWKVTPVGAMDGRQMPQAFREVMSKTFTDFRIPLDTCEPAVLAWDSAFGGESDFALITTAVDVLVDHLLAMNQLEMLVSSPVVYRCTRNNIGDAKNSFLAMAEHRPALFTYDEAEQALPAFETTNVTIDPTVITLYSHWESVLLQQLGIPTAASPEKHSQMSVLEASLTLGESPVDLRRREKLFFRQKMVDELNECFGTHVTVLSVIDSMKDDQEDAEEHGEEEEMKDENE